VVGNTGTETQDNLYMSCPVTHLVGFYSALGIHVLDELDINYWMLHWLTFSG